MNAEYLDRSLTQRVGAARQQSAAALDGIMRRHAAAGRLASGATLKAFTDETAQGFKTAYLEAQQFTFDLVGENCPGPANNLGIACGALTHGSASPSCG